MHHQEREYRKLYREMLGLKAHAPDCGDYGPCACGPCERCDDEGFEDIDVEDSDIGWRAVRRVCPTCQGTKVDPEARA